MIDRTVSFQKPNFTAPIASVPVDFLQKFTAKNC